MEENVTPAPDYIKGFNEGYTIAEYLPELAAKLKEAVDKSVRGQGFKSGITEYQLEQKTRNAFSLRYNDKNPDLDNEKGMDKNDIADLDKEME